MDGLERTIAALADVTSGPVDECLSLAEMITEHREPPHAFSQLEYIHTAPRGLWIRLSNCLRVRRTAVWQVRRGYNDDHWLGGTFVIEGGWQIDPVGDGRPTRLPRQIFFGLLPDLSKADPRVLGHPAGYRGDRDGPCLLVIGVRSSSRSDCPLAI